MNQPFIKLGTTLIVATSLALGAFAQESKPLGVSARLGLFFPSSNAAQDEGANWLGIGLDYKLGDLKSGAAKGYNASYGLSLDYFNKGDFRSLPILLTYTGRQERFYYTVGGGVSLNKVAQGGGSRSDTEFAYAVGLGVDFTRFNQPMFAELRWMGNSDSTLSGFGVFVGIRF